MNMVGRSNTKHNKVIVKVKVNMNGSLWEMRKLVVVNVQCQCNFQGQGQV